ncbi:flagellar hook-basal body complex protein FliE [Desulfospira joergensenii]|uniref:flagellar hook-basal body complex protein FliE n=1 Tax=Desulfospira joergensenii TaxID=53329 RepID=UPI0003B3167B|nr:flagellar hook-basal body complex protein FliE [Desulfospira joergensenii]
MTDMNAIQGRTHLKTESIASRAERRNPEFSQRLKSAVLDVNSKQHTADQSAEAVIKGEMGIHEGMMAMGKADTSLRLLAQVRNKVMTAYNEIMRMQI